MKISKTMWAIVAAIVVAGGLFWFTSSTSTTDTTPTDQISTNQLAVSAIRVDEDGTVVTYEGVANETALATMKARIAVRTQVSDFGEFVTGIGDVDSDSSKNFWGYTVNGDFAEVGAGEYVATEGDQIEWRLTDLN